MLWAARMACGLATVHGRSFCPANLVWEAAQLPLFTVWRKDSWGEIAFAVLHCTGGDVLIAGASLVAALLFLGSAGWPNERYTR